MELVLAEHVLRLDDTVVEVLHVSGACERFHVLHVAVEAKPRRDGRVRLRIGVDGGFGITGGVAFDLPPERAAEVDAFFAEARRRRAAAGGPP